MPLLYKISLLKRFHMDHHKFGYKTIKNLFIEDFPLSSICFIKIIYVQISKILLKMALFRYHYNTFQNKQ